MRVLGIESSCDDTSAAVVEDGWRVLANVVSSQTEVHARFGGVVPEIASRRHLERIDVVIAAALEQAGCALAEIDGIAVTNRPGLIGALVVGLTAAKSYAWAVGKPVIGVHHIQAHLHASRLDCEAPPRPPFVGLVASGGHSDLIWAPDWLDMQLLGETRDDAAGEAFDKVARHLDLGYPGGPAVQRVAEGASDPFPLPIADLDDSLDFSFSGVKTAVVRLAERLGPEEARARQADIAAGFQRAVVEPLARNAVRACRERDATELAVGGGVAANALLRARLAELCGEAGIRLTLAPLRYCTDNGAMVAAAGCVALAAGRVDDLMLDCVSTDPLPWWAGP